jgi:DNA-binding NarL/FixJ family response regulator
MTRVVVADDHPIFVRGLVSVLEGAGCHVVGEASDGERLLELVRGARPDVAIVDVGMPVLDGLGVLRRAREEKLCCRFLVLSLHEERAIVNAALELGARGYVLKDNAADDVVAAVQAVADGRDWKRPVVDEPIPDGLSRLSNAELRVLALLAENMTSPQIADELGLSVRTVQNHRAHICEKLQLSGNNRLLQVALESRDRIRALLRAADAVSSSK